MKEIVRTPVPLPVPRPRPKPKEPPARPQLSQEIVDSDEDSSHESAAKVKPPTKLQTTIAIHTPNGAARRPKEKPKGKSFAQEKPAGKSASQSKHAPKNAAPEPAALSSSAEPSEDSDASRAGERTNPAGSAKSSDIINDSDSGSSSEDGSGDEFEVETAPQAATADGQKIVDRQMPRPQSHAIDFQPSQPYIPPKGFNRVPLDDRTIANTARIFENLGNKQIWHITAPAGISLKEMRQLAMDKVLDGQALLTYKGIDYGFSPTVQSEDLAQEVLVPGKTVYKAVPARISQTLRLQAVVRLPELSHQQADVDSSSAAAASITRSTIRTPRAQVKGLKMRFLPSGFGGDAAGTMGNSDDETNAATKTTKLGMSVGLKLPSRQKEKRKHADLTGPESVEAPAKRSKQQHQSAEDLKRKAERRAKKEKRRAHEASSAKP